MDPERPPRQPTDAAAELFAELDRLGEAEVRQRLDAGAFAPVQVPFAREWLLRVVENRARKEADRG